MGWKRHAPIDPKLTFLRSASLIGARASALDRRDIEDGGEGGIRTPDRLAPMPHFECGAFNHSATSPGAKSGPSPPWSGRVIGEDA